MEEILLIKDLLNEEKYNSLSSFINRLHKYYAEKPIISSEFLTSDLIDIELIDEIKNLPANISVFFGKTLREIKCNIMDGEGIREHEIYLRYEGHHRLAITDVKLPYSSLQDREYSSIEEVATVFENYIKSLALYFQELENIDRQCTVVEPINPTFKDDYRRILLDGRTWLHIEVDADGLAKNIHLNRQSKQLDEKLNRGLLAWDHDKNIVENINCIFDLDNVAEKEIKHSEQLDAPTEMPCCSICTCVHLTDCPGLPQLLCENPKCDAYYHKYCLFQWLVASMGGRLPPFGVANGSCPTCLQPITCSERDD